MAGYFDKEFYANFKIFHELMSRKIREILLVSSPYDAFILEEDGSLASRIINEYRGLNLSQPPRVKRIASATEALALLEKRHIDLVLTMPHLAEMDVFTFGLEVKKRRPELPVILLAHSSRGIYPVPENRDASGIDRIAIWSGNSDLLMALVKNMEDRMNVDHDTARAMVRVLLLVEDSPVYQSSFLPLIYKEVVRQTQSILGEGLNEEHRLLKMRARPKILLAESHEEAMDLFDRYREYVFGVISDTRMPKGGEMVDRAGSLLLEKIKQELPDLPLLMLSSESDNEQLAAGIPAVFIDKNSKNLLTELRAFFLDHLGFGDFIFRSPDGKELARASSLRELQLRIAEMPDDCLWYHASRNHFSHWIMARSEIPLASKFRKVPASDFDTVDDMRAYLTANIQTMRIFRQKGVVAQFKRHQFDADTMDFVKIGSGSLGGKARSLAFMSALLQQHPDIHEAYPHINVRIPKTMVISTDGFEEFINAHQLRDLACDDVGDGTVSRRFLDARLPQGLIDDLEVFLQQVTYPLSVRSSSLLEDAQFQPYAGLYETYMIPNNHPDLDVRLNQLVNAVKLVYASTYFEGPKAFSRNICSQPEAEAMAVIVQELAGHAHGDFFYPTLSGVAQSHNFYPVPPMKTEDGVAHIALGFGRTVVQGERALRFSPRHPDVLPQFSTVDDILNNAQRFFYALRIRACADDIDFSKDANLEKRDLDDADGEPPVRMLAGTYSLDDHRIRDSAVSDGPKVLTFSRILKYNQYRLPELLDDLLDIGKTGMGCPVEIEFSVNINESDRPSVDFYFLQMRPMAAETDQFEIDIRPEEINNAICRSDQALGNGRLTGIVDIIHVKPADFDLRETASMAEEIGQFNAGLQAADRPYLLVGPGRWGSTDRWLGIPVKWQHISGAAAIVELRNDDLKADPSQGSHFFQNITALGIPYFTVTENGDGFIDWQWLAGLETLGESAHIRHCRSLQPIHIKVDGRSGRGVMAAG